MLEIKSVSDLRKCEKQDADIGMPSMQCRAYKQDLTLHIAFLA